MDLVNPVVQRVCREASERPEQFWDKAARDLHWFRTWDTVLDWQPPTFTWCVGGRTNLAYNCFDRHLGTIEVETALLKHPAVAVIGELSFVGLVPKTRGGKIIRRVLKAVTLDRDPGDVTTIEDETSVEEARQSWLQLKEAVAQGRS